MKIVGYDSDSVAYDLIHNKGKYKIPKHALLDYGITESLNEAKAKSENKNKPAISTGEKCCYCERGLTTKNRTREHVIPRHKGGKIIKIACKYCNQEKGGLMLNSYIQLLELKLSNTKEDTNRHSVLKIKIRNANIIAKEIDDDNTN